MPRMDVWSLHPLQSALEEATQVPELSLSLAGLRRGKSHDGAGAK